jgi:ectoine hydroxylase
MNYRQDFYPTRSDRDIPYFPRLDPVIYSNEEQRQRGPLCPSLLRSYEENGYLFFDSFYPEKKIQEFIDDLTDYGNNVDLKAKDQVITEPHADTIRSIFAIHELSERFRQLTCETLLLDIAHQLLSSDVYIHQSRLNNKPGFTGTGFKWHSDFETWHSEDGMPRMRCFSLSILLTENNALNGPLMLIPKSHRFFIPTRGRTPKRYWKKSLKNQTVGIPTIDSLRDMTNRGRIVAPAGPAGSLIIFDCNTLHASSDNLSPYPRCNLFFVYNSIENSLQQPYCGQAPRPEFVATRQQFAPLQALGSDVSTNLESANLESTNLSSTSLAEINDAETQPQSQAIHGDAKTSERALL